MSSTENNHRRPSKRQLLNIFIALMDFLGDCDAWKWTLEAVKRWSLNMTVDWDNIGNVLAVLKSDLWSGSLKGRSNVCLSNWPHTMDPMVSKHSSWGVRFPSFIRLCLLGGNGSRDIIQIPSKILFLSWTIACKCGSR